MNWTLWKGVMWSVVCTLLGLSIAAGGGVLYCKLMNKAPCQELCVKQGFETSSVKLKDFGPIQVYCNCGKYYKLPIGF